MAVRKLDVDALGFGQVFTDHMFIMSYQEQGGWNAGEIKKYEPFRFNPAAIVLHYAQTVFEGLKAYKSRDGRILLFRPERNARRFRGAAQRMCMPDIAEEVFLKAVQELVLLDQEWIPEAPGTSLYIRPVLLGIDARLGVQPSREYIFYIILSPVGSYYKGGFQPVSIYVEDVLVRASLGGVGNIKTGTNYAASLLAGQRAAQRGHSQVLWLDAKEHRYVEEVGSMNVFFVYGRKLITPPLTGSILPGVTRDSVLGLVRDLGLEAEEAPLSIEQALNDIQSGQITEVFGSGTAAVLSPVGSLHYRNKDYIINNNRVGEVTQLIYDRLVGIQYGYIRDDYGWTVELARA